MRSAVGGCVENSFAMRSLARNGLSIIMCDWAAMSGFGGSGAACTPPEIFASADARARGSPVSSAPDSSAWNSLDRDTASFTRVAAMGPRRATSSMASGFGPLPSRFPPNAPANIAKFARPLMIDAIAPAIELIRMSRLYTCDSSCPSTARNSRSSRICRMPVVQQTAAFFGLRPVAKAFGDSVGEM